MNEQILHSIDRSKYISYLEEMGVDISIVKMEIINKLNEDEMDAFINRSENLLSPNIYIESVIFECACRYLHKDFKHSIVLGGEIKIDIKTIVATSKSLIKRPNKIKPIDSTGGFREPDYIDGFRVISRFEREIGENHQRKNIKRNSAVVFEGLLPKKIEVNPLMDKCPSNFIWESSYLEWPFIQGFNACFNGLEAQYVLWMNSELLSMLGLKLDSHNNGLRALNSNGEIVLIFRCWREPLISIGSSFVGTHSNIARLDGCDLILREDYFQILKCIIPSMVYYVEVI
jgi:hypothetical protein